MRRSCWNHMSLIFACGLLTLGLCGCGAAPTEQTAKASATVGATPVETVQLFLDAMKAGDEVKADQMLTKRARQETQKAGLHISPPGSATAKYQVGESEIEGDGAQVFCTWTDMDENGQTQTDKIVWLLRKEVEGWRIAGLATELFPGEDPLIINFEDTEDMMKKQEMAQRELEIREATDTLKQAQQSSETAVAPK